jgi:predicted AAA+ superfamily ATPase
MKRKLTEELLRWKSSKRRKPLLLNGARQVGKTYLLKEFAKQNYDDVAYFNLEHSSRAAGFFDGDLKPEGIIAHLAALRGRIITPEATLIILDEIQINERAITALKYFQELAPQYHVAAAGSLLGIALGREKSSFPVGKVNSLTLYPMDFEEYLWATGQELLAGLIQNAFEGNEGFALHDVALEAYRRYVVVGGMPESIIESLDNPSLIGFGEVLREIDNDYIKDMVKYATAYEAGRIIEVWESIPGQLEKENHKFQYRHIKSGARASHYEVPVTWLNTAHIVNKCVLAQVAQEPLRLHADNNSFKLYMADSGLLCAKLGVEPTHMLHNTVESSRFRGILAENYVMQHLVSKGLTPYYWKSKGKAEIEFIMQDKTAGVIPLEVKSGNNVRSQSLRTFVQSFAPNYSIRLSTKNFGFENGIRSVPLYAAFCL